MLESLNLFDILGIICVGILFVFCLPIARLTKWILELTTWSLRLAMIAVLAVGVVFWLYPERVPNEVNTVYQSLPLPIQETVPDPNGPIFSLVLSCVIVVICLPLLTGLEVCRRLAGSTTSQLSKLARESEAQGYTNQTLGNVRRHNQHNTAAPKGFKIQDSANAMAGASSSQRKPPRVSDYLN